MIVGTLAHIYLAWRFSRAERHQKQNLQNVVYWRDLYVALVLFLAAGRGTAGILFVPLDSPPHQFLTAFILGAMAVGGMTILAAVYFVCAAFQILTLLPITINAITMGTEYGP